MVEVHVCSATELPIGLIDIRKALNDNTCFSQWILSDSGERPAYMTYCDSKPPRGVGRVMLMYYQKCGRSSIG